MRTLAFFRRLAPSVAILVPSSSPQRAVWAGLAGVVLAAAACGDPPRRFTEPLMLGGQEVPPEVLDRGARVYGLYCVSCHGADGSGRATASRSSGSPPRDFREADFQYVSGAPGSLPTDTDLEATIRHGRPATGMPAWDGLPAEDLHAVIQFLKTLSPRWASEVPEPGPAPAGRVGEG